MTLNVQASEILANLGAVFHAGDLPVDTPIDGSRIGSFATATPAEIDAALTQVQEAFLLWRAVPAPRRGELVRLFGNALRDHKADLARLVTIECGKPISEGEGEVQEMIDICDFAVGLSRQLHGLTIASERPGHRMMEQWHPLGPVLIISAFNFPVAVWAWNATLALVCGNSIVWKPSEKTPLTALAVQALLDNVLKDFDEAPDGLSQVIIGARDTGATLAADPRIALVSATGSTAMGRAVGQVAAARFAKTILELGGNNAMVVAPSADLKMVLPAVLFSAVGTAGQRCTTLRRLIVHLSVYDQLLASLKNAYGSVRIGNPLTAGTLVGPLVDGAAYNGMQTALANAVNEGGKVHGGARVTTGDMAKAFYVQPAIVEMPSQTNTVCHETFAPILYVLKYDTLDQALALQNGVPQGLSSAIFTTDVREAEQFLAASGSDCGIANVNIGTSGAEIGGAFGGEKETGGGRESGSDSWKAYMRRATNTVNYSRELPLAQGIKFDI